jgi:hypothetical protein
MLPPALRKLAGHADVEYAAWCTGEDVDPIGSGVSRIMRKTADVGSLSIDVI